VRETPLPVVLHAVRTGDVSVLRDVPDEASRTTRTGRGTWRAAGVAGATVARVAAVAATLVAGSVAVVGIVLLGGP